MYEQPDRKGSLFRFVTDRDLTNNLTVFYMNPVNIVSTGKILTTKNLTENNLNC